MLCISFSGDLNNSKAVLFFMLRPRKRNIKRGEKFDPKIHLERRKSEPYLVRIKQVGDAPFNISDKLEAFTLGAKKSKKPGQLTKVGGIYIHSPHHGNEMPIYYDKRTKLHAYQQSKEKSRKKK